jgi:hypothetical protein
MAKPVFTTLIWGALCLTAAGLSSAQEPPIATATATAAPAPAAPAPAPLSKTARDGIRLVEDKQYRQAIEYLVRAGGEGSKDAIIQEFLTIAYLSVPPSADIKDMMRGANEAARRAIEYGGCAPFIVDRSTSSRFDKNFTDGERGRLRVCKDRLEFQAARTDTTFTIAPSEITEFGFNSFKGGTKAAFHIKTKNKSGKKTHDFRPASFSERDPDLLFELMTELWKIHPTL